MVQSSRILKSHQLKTITKHMIIFTKTNIYKSILKKKDRTKLKM